MANPLLKVAQIEALASPCKKLIDYTQTTDCWSNVTLGGGAWNSISGVAVPNFTVSPGAAFILVTLTLGALWSGHSIAAQVASGIFIDGGWAASYGVTYVEVGRPVVCLNGGTVLMACAPGTHSITPRIYATAGVNAGYLRPGTNPYTEFLRVGVIEVH